MQSLPSQTLVLAPPGHSMPTGRHRVEAHSQHAPSGHFAGPQVSALASCKRQASSTTAEKDGIARDGCGEWKRLLRTREHRLLLRIDG